MGASSLSHSPISSVLCPQYKPVVQVLALESVHLWGDVKYYFADFVCKGGGGTPQIRNPLFAENFVR